MRPITKSLILAVFVASFALPATSFARGDIMDSISDLAEEYGTTAVEGKFERSQEIREAKRDYEEEILDIRNDCEDEAYEIQHEDRSDRRYRLKRLQRECDREMAEAHREFKHEMEDIEYDYQNERREVVNDGVSDLVSEGISSIFDN